MYTYIYIYIYIYTLTICSCAVVFIIRDTFIMFKSITNENIVLVDIKNCRFNFVQLFALYHSKVFIQLCTINTSVFIS